MAVDRARAPPAVPPPTLRCLTVPPPPAVALDGAALGALHPEPTEVALAGADG